MKNFLRHSLLMVRVIGWQAVDHPIKCGNKKHQFKQVNRAEEVIGKTRPDTRPYDALSLVLIVVLVKNGTFAWFQLVCDGPTDGRTDGPTDGRTDGQTLL